VSSGAATSWVSAQATLKKRKGCRSVTDQQSYLAIGVPIVVNITALGIFATLLVAHANAKFEALRAEMNARFEGMRDLWHAELHRVEGVLDARLKHLEERETH
jgi:hypothetical protein